MKNLILVLIIAMFPLTEILSQWETHSLPLQTYGINDFISNVTFPNAEIGYVTAGSITAGYTPINLYKTTNKGVNWTQVSNNIGSETSQGMPALYFVNLNLGFLVTNINQGSYVQMFKIYKTTNGGVNWSLFSSFSTTYESILNPELYFLNENTGYFWHELALYKTTNGGNNWTEIFNKSLGNDFLAINDIEVSKLNNEVIYVGGIKYIYNGFPVLYKSENGGQNFTAICDGESNQNLVYGINNLSLINVNGLDALYAAAYGGVAKLEGSELDIISVPLPTNAFIHKDIMFTKENHAVLYAEARDQESYNNYIVFSSNGGYSWSNSIDFYRMKVNSFCSTGDIINASASNRYVVSGQPETFVLTKKITIYGQYAFDLIPNPGYEGAIAVDDLAGGGGILFIPGSLEVYGGTLNVSTERILENGNKIFYKWESNGMNSNGAYVYTDRYDDPITAHFKTKLKSTIPNAISPVSQTKAIKDTNGVINLLYSSMGGIFYTRSTDNGATFGTEEIVNYHPSEFSGTDNYNPCLAEIKPYFINHPYPVLGTQNMAAIWERREGNTIKIRFSERENGEPEPPINWKQPVDLFTIEAPSGFECKPKLFMVKEYNNWDSLVAVLYLKSVNGVNQLWIYGRNRKPDLTYNSCIINGSNISSFSATAIMKNYAGNSLSIHIAYVQDGHIKYTHGYLEASYDYGVNFNWPYESENFTISNLDILQNRGEPDITLRNKSDNPNEFDMQPVVTFKGQQTVRIINQQGDGNPTQQNYTYYAIVVRERLSNSTWGSNFWYYNTVVKQSPNIEGAKKRNAYILNYKHGSLYLQKVLKWGTNGGYFCDPGYFAGIDAKFVRGGLVDLSSTQQRLVGLSGSSSPYQVSIEPSTITMNPSNPDNPVHEIRGIVVNDNIKYSFNLGSITVNSEMIDFGDDIDTSIGGGGELNENLISKPFLLNDSDTLIIGRNASYLDQGGGEFTEVQYAVYLTYNSSGQKFLELARDTVHAGDSIQVEYLEGFIIQNIPNGSDSFYVQMEIDTVWAGGGDDFGMNNISNDEGGEGDNTAMKKYVFWKNANVVTNNIPTAFNLYQNFPNPFNPLTKIKYDLPKNVNVTVKVYDLLGREVAILVNNEFKTVGRYEINWDAMNFASGVYIYRIQAGDYISTKKMVLVK